MKTVLLGFAVLSLSSCGGLIAFDVSQQGEATIPGSTLLGQVLGGIPGMQGLTSFDVSQSQEFENHNAEKGMVKSAKLSSLTLKITAPSDADFSFLDSIEFWAEADGTSTRVAHKSGIASLGLKAPNPTLTLELDDVDLVAFIKADSMSITSKASGRQPSKDTTLQATAVFHVSVGP
ncbi:MAG: hypothetical protein QM765_41250 [Myxococcales bacterium]